MHWQNCYLIIGGVGLALWDERSRMIQGRAHH